MFSNDASDYYASRMFSYIFPTWRLQLPCVLPRELSSQIILKPFTAEIANMPVLTAVRLLVQFKPMFGLKYLIARVTSSRPTGVTYFVELKSGGCGKDFITNITCELMFCSRIVCNHVSLETRCWFKRFSTCMFRANKVIIFFAKMILVALGSLMHQLYDRLTSLLDDYLQLRDHYHMKTTPGTVVPHRLLMNLTHSRAHNQLKKNLWTLDQLNHQAKD